MRWASRTSPWWAETVKALCALLIEKAHAKGRPVGICGQAPSDYP